MINMAIFKLVLLKSKAILRLIETNICSSNCGERKKSKGLKLPLKLLVSHKWYFEKFHQICAWRNWVNEPQAEVPLMIRVTQNQMEFSWNKGSQRDITNYAMNCRSFKQKPILTDLCITKCTTHPIGISLNSHLFQKCPTQHFFLMQVIFLICIIIFFFLISRKQFGWEALFFN